MSFLDNSGDIILDAVLTDTGRFRLAKGDGSFKIVKFALADDEINYGNYNKNHASGSAYYDLSVLQTPVLEAFTNNTSTMKSKLISIPETNLLYLPILKLNASATDSSELNGNNGGFGIAVDNATVTSFSTLDGVLDGVNPDKSPITIRIDQGLDTTELSPSMELQSNLVETQYILQLDNRFGSITDVNGNATDPSFIDDDNIAHYYVTQGDGGYVSNIETNPENVQQYQVISGPRGTQLAVRIKSSVELYSSTYLFTTLGSSGTKNDTAGASQSINFIDTTLRVMGATTGYALDIPIRFIKKA